MDENKNGSACNTNLDKDNYKKDRTVCKDFYNKNKKNKSNTLIQNQQPKIENVKNTDNNRTLTIGCSKFGNI